VKRDFSITKNTAYSKGEIMKYRHRKLKCRGYDIKRYREFLERLKEDLCKRGFDQKDAEASAREIAEMYKHHFRVWN
jgi:ASC-1-like (ASCH) protein